MAQPFMREGDPNHYDADAAKLAWARTLEFLKKAYGPGDVVSATIEVKRPTGEPFAERELTGLLTLDGAELPPVRVVLDGKGAGIVSVSLPASIERGDGILTLLIDDFNRAQHLHCGVTESRSLIERL